MFWPMLLLGAYLVVLVTGQSRIHPPPTELSTAKLLLERANSGMRALHQDHNVVVLDQSLYSKAPDIVWKDSFEYSALALCMGAFHVIRAFLPVIGEQFNCSELGESLVEPAAAGSRSL